MLRLAIAINDQDSEAHLFLAFALNEQEKFDEAQAEYVETCRIAPQWVVAQRMLATFYWDRGQLSAAEAVLKHAWTLDETDARTAYLLAKLSFQAGQTTEARRWLERALALDPQHEGALKLAEQMT